MIDHEFTRPVIFTSGRSLAHICQGRINPRHDVWEAHHGPERGEEVRMVFCWSCLTLFVHEASREAYLAWTAGSWGASVDRQRQRRDQLLKIAELDRSRPDPPTARLEHVDAGPTEPMTIERALPHRGILLIDHDALSSEDSQRMEARGWTVIRKQPGRSVSVIPLP